jgi:hypothetical protein
LFPSIITLEFPELEASVGLESIAFDATLTLPSKDARLAALDVPFPTGPSLMDR